MTRPRPVVHFTPRTGWVNDPYGVHWDGERYHLFYQALPDRTTWAANCSWGHAVSPDLVRWTEVHTALVPREFESGCWSGAVVPAGARGGLAFYTRMRADDAGLSQIAVARPGGPRGTWRSDPADVVIDGPPPDLGITAFRDPFVWAGGDRGWSMVVGAGCADGRGAVLLYTSADLLEWHHEGILLAGFADPGRPGHGEVWECPQLVEVDGRWVLVISVMADGRAHHVSASVGEFDGRTFTHDRWQSLSRGDRVYATSVFRDRDDTPCVISWLQERPDHVAATSPWAGGHTAPSTVRVDASGQVSVSMHPDVRHAAAAGGPDVALHRLERGGTTRVRLGEGTLEVVLRGDEVEVVHADGTVHTVPLAGTHVAEVLVDADIVEVFTGAGYGAWRLPLV